MIRLVAIRALIVATLICVLAQTISGGQSIVYGAMSTPATNHGAMLRMSPTVTIILIAIIVASFVGLYFINPQKAENDAIATTRSAGVQSLQQRRRVPEISNDPGETNAFRVSWTIWFEALLGETFERPADFPKDVAFLTAQYVRALQAFRDYVSPKLMSAADAPPMLADQYLWYAPTLHQALDWLHRQATTYNAAADRKGASVVRWDPSVVESTFLHQTGTSQLVGVRTGFSFEFRAAPAVLDAEIARLSAATADAADLIAEIARRSAATADTPPWA